MMADPWAEFSDVTDGPGVATADDAWGSFEAVDQDWGGFVDADAPVKADAAPASKPIKLPPIVPMAAPAPVGPQLPDDATEYEMLKFAKMNELFTGEPRNDMRPIFKDLYESETDPVRKKERLNDLRVHERRYNTDKEAIAKERAAMEESGLDLEQQWAKDMADFGNDPDSRLANTPVLRGMMTGAQNVASMIGETALRILPGEGAPSKLADKLGRLRQDEEAIQGALDDEQGKIAQYSAAVPKMIAEYMPLAALTGGASAWGQAASSGTNDGYVTGKKAGLKGDALDNYALASGAMQGMFTYLGGKLGAGTVEEMLGGQVAKKTAAGLLRSYAAELGEEFGQLFTQAAIDKESKVGSGKVTAEQALDTLAIVTLAQGAGAAMARGPAARRQAKKAKAFVDNPSRTNAEMAGVDEIATTRMRREELAAKIKQAMGEHDAERSRGDQGALPAPVADKVKIDITEHTDKVINEKSFRAILSDGDKEIGRGFGDIKNGKFIVRNLGIDDEAYRGRGVGIKLYEQMIEHAESRGLQFVSDSSLTEDAVRVYDGLRKRGYKVERNPEAIDETNEDGTTTTHIPRGKGGYVFTVASRNPKPAVAVEPAVEPEPPPEPLADPVVPSPQAAAFAAKSVLDPQNVVRGAKATASWFKRNFTSKGDANEPMIDLLFERDGRIREHVSRASINSRDLQAAAKKAYRVPFMRQIPDTVAQRLDEALKDPAVMATLPPDVAVPLTEMRDHIDALSQIVMGLPDIGPDLQLTIQQNLGKYVTRTYKKFGPKPTKWMEQALGDQQIMADFTAELHAAAAQNGLPMPTDDEVRQTAQTLLLEGTSRVAETGGAKPRTTKYTDVLKKRKDLSPAIRNLYGENRDAFTNYAETVSKLSSLVAHRKFVEELKNNGLQLGFFSDPAQPAPGHIKRVNHQQLRQLGPLSDIVTTPELADAIDDLYAVSGPNMAARTLLLTSGLTKVAATAYSWQATVRNLTGNWPIAIANGAFNPRDFATAGKTVWWQDMLNKGDAQAKAEIIDLNRLGLMEDVSVSQLSDMAKDVSISVQNYMAGIDSRNQFKRATRGVARFYQSMDSVWKVATFYNYLPKYRAANPQMTDPELRAHVAQIVRSITPTYSEASKAAKFWARYVPLGPFAMFSAEMWRTTANRVRLTIEELRSGNPELQKLGAQKAVGQAAILGAAGAAALAAKAMLGMSDEEEEALRQRVAPWQRNSTLIPLGINKETGTIDYFDAGYNDPFSLFTGPVNALLRGEPAEAAAEVAEPFLSEDIAYGAIVSMIRGTDENGRPIYDQGLTATEQNKQIAKFIASKFVPGTLRSVGRIEKAAKGETSKYGKAYDVAGEILSFVAGVKMEEMDRQQSDFFRNRGYSESVKDSERSIRLLFLSKGTPDFADIERKYRSAEEKRRTTLAAWREYVDGSIALGETNAYAKVVEDVGSRSATIDLMYTGVYQPFKFRDTDLRKMLGLEQGQQRMELYEKMSAEFGNPR